MKRLLILTAALLALASCNRKDDDPGASCTERARQLYALEFDRYDAACRGDTAVSAARQRDIDRMYAEGLSAGCFHACTLEQLQQNTCPAGSGYLRLKEEHPYPFDPSIEPKMRMVREGRRAACDSLAGWRARYF